MKTGYIYKITSPSGKIYIGSTYDFNRRFKEYKYLKCKEQPKIYNSLNKYGFDNHTIEVIEEPTLDTMLEREAYWGEYYDVLSSKGLNLALPKFGDTYKGVSEETKEKLSTYNKGKVLTEETRLKIANKRMGKTHSKETRLKMSKAQKGRKLSDTHRANLSASKKGRVNCKLVLDTATGIFYNSATEAAEVYNINKAILFDWLGRYKHRNKTTLIYV